MRRRIDTKNFVHSQTLATKISQAQNAPLITTTSMSRSAGAPPAPADQPQPEPPKRSPNKELQPSTSKARQSAQIHSNLHKPSRFLLTLLPISYIMLTYKSGWITAQSNGPLRASHNESLSTSDH